MFFGFFLSSVNCLFNMSRLKQRGIPQYFGKFMKPKLVISPISWYLKKKKVRWCIRKKNVQFTSDLVWVSDEIFLSNASCFEEALLWRKTFSCKAYTCTEPLLDMEGLWSWPTMCGVGGSHGPQAAPPSSLMARLGTDGQRGPPRGHAAWLNLPEAWQHPACICLQPCLHVCQQMLAARKAERWRPAWRCKHFSTEDKPRAPRGAPADFGCSLTPHHHHSFHIPMHTP